MKKVPIYLMGFLAVVLGASSAHAAGSATLDFVEHQVEVETGDVFDMTMVVNSHGESYDTIRADVSFPNKNLEVIKFVLENASPLVSPGNFIDNSKGQFSLGSHTTGYKINESRVYAKVTLRALEPGQATLQIDDTSRVIQTGEEKINASALGKGVVTVKPKAPVKPVAQQIKTYPLELQRRAIGTFGAFKGFLPAKHEEWQVILTMLEGYQGRRNLEKERVAISRYITKYKKAPSSDFEWKVVAALAYHDNF
jgi:hypothetical protein